MKVRLGGVFNKIEGLGPTSFKNFTCSAEELELLKGFAKNKRLAGADKIAAGSVVRQFVLLPEDKKDRGVTAVYDVTGESGQGLELHFFAPGTLRVIQKEHDTSLLILKAEPTKGVVEHKSVSGVVGAGPEILQAHLSVPPGSNLSNLVCVSSARVVLSTEQLPSPQAQLPPEVDLLTPTTRLIELIAAPDPVAKGSRVLYMNPVVYWRFPKQPQSISSKEPETILRMIAEIIADQADFASLQVVRKQMIAEIFEKFEGLRPKVGALKDDDLFKEMHVLAAQQQSAKNPKQIYECYLAEQKIVDTILHLYGNGKDPRISHQFFSLLYALQLCSPALFLSFFHKKPAFYLEGYGLEIFAQLADSLPKLAAYLKDLLSSATSPEITQLPMPVHTALHNIFQALKLIQTQLPHTQRTMYNTWLKILEKNLALCQYVHELLIHMSNVFSDTVAKLEFGAKQPPGVVGRVIGDTAENLTFHINFPDITVAKDVNLRAILDKEAFDYLMQHPKDLTNPSIRQAIGAELHRSGVLPPYLDIAAAIWFVMMDPSGYSDLCERWDYKEYPNEPWKRRYPRLTEYPQPDDVGVPALVQAISHRGPEVLKIAELLRTRAKAFAEAQEMKAQPCTVEDAASDCQAEQAEASASSAQAVRESLVLYARLLKNPVEKPGGTMPGAVAKYHRGTDEKLTVLLKASLPFVREARTGQVADPLQVALIEPSAAAVLASLLPQCMVPRFFLVSLKPSFYLDRSPIGANLLAEDQRNKECLHTASTWIDGLKFAKELWVKLEDGRIVLFIEALKKGVIPTTVRYGTNTPDIPFDAKRFIELLAIARLMGNPDLVGFDGGNFAVIYKNGELVPVCPDLGEAFLDLSATPPNEIPWGCGTPEDPAILRLESLTPEQQAQYLEAIKSYGARLTTLEDPIQPEQLSGLAPQQEINDALIALAQLRRKTARDVLLRYHSLLKADQQPMTEEGSWEEPPIELCCPVSTELFADPVQTSAGQTYDREVIERWFASCRQRGQKPTDPMTNLDLENTKLTPNIEMRTRVNAFRAQHEKPALPELRAVEPSAPQATGGVILKSESKSVSGTSGTFRSAAASSAPPMFFPRAPEQEQQQQPQALHYNDWRRFLAARGRAGFLSTAFHDPLFSRKPVVEPGHHSQHPTYDRVVSASDGLTDKKRAAAQDTASSSRRLGFSPTGGT